MEAIINSRYQFRRIRGLVVLIRHFRVVESIDRIIRKFNFHNESGLLQFWACKRSNSEDIGCNLMLTNQPFKLNQDHEGLLQDYRRRCLETSYPFVGIDTSVGNWLAGRAAQTRIADHRTIHHVLDKEDQHSADVGSKGQLVLPVFYHDQGAPAGIIEFVTPVPKESYVKDFEQIHNLLKDEGLISIYMGKMIKVKYNVDDTYKFPLPLSAELTHLHEEVTKRIPELKHQKMYLEYEHTEDISACGHGRVNYLPISSDEDLQVCMAESSSKGAKYISMRLRVSRKRNLLDSAQKETLVSDVTARRREN